MQIAINIFFIIYFIIIVGCLQSKKNEDTTTKILIQDSLGISLEVVELDRDTTFNQKNLSNEIIYYRNQGIIKNNSTKPIYLLTIKDNFIEEKNRFIVITQKLVGQISFDEQNPSEVAATKLNSKDSLTCYFNLNHYFDSKIIGYNNLTLGYLKEDFRQLKRPNDQDFISKIQHLSINIQKLDSGLKVYNAGE